MGNQVNPQATVIGDVQFGDDNVVEAGAILIGPMSIGDGNYFGPSCVIGAPPQMVVVSDELRRLGVLAGSDQSIAIGSQNVFREFVTLHRGLTRSTRVGSNCYVMSYAHIPHDCTLNNNVRLANNVQMGGYTWLGRGVYVGLSAVIHQFTTIGACTMVGMGSVVTMSEVPLGSLLHGSPARLIRANSIGLESIGVHDVDWWEPLSSGVEDVRVPPELDRDLADYRSAINAAQLSRVEMNVLLRRPDTGGGS